MNFFQTLRDKFLVVLKSGEERLVEIVPVQTREKIRDLLKNHHEERNPWIDGGCLNEAKKKGRNRVVTTVDSARAQA